MPRATQPNLDLTVEIGIVCALDLEAAAIIRRFEHRSTTIARGFTVVRGSMSGRSVAVVRSTSGRQRFAAAMDAMFQVHRPKWLIAAGFAVGVDQRATRGDLVVASEVASDGDEREQTHSSWRAAAKLVQGVKSGPLVSVGALPRTAAQKRELSAKTAAIAADQHSWSLARMCSDRGIRFLAVRVLVDDASGDSEPGSRAVYHPSASFRAGGVVGAFLSGSGHVAKIWKIRSAAKRHAARLAEFLANLVPRLR